MAKYDVDLFDPLPDPNLLCPICRCVLHEPVECDCRHVFCRQCISTWLEQHSSCPECRQFCTIDSLQPILPLVQNIINCLRMRCPNEINGCTNRIVLEAYENHAKICDYEVLNCNWQHCEKKYLRKEVDDHEKICDWRLITCEGKCGLTVIAKNVHSHSCVDALLHKVKEQEYQLKRLKYHEHTLDMSQDVSSNHYGSAVNLVYSDSDNTSSSSSMSRITASYNDSDSVHLLSMDDDSSMAFSDETSDVELEENASSPFVDDLSDVELRNDDRADAQWYSNDVLFTNCHNLTVDSTDCGYSLNYMVSDSDDENECTSDSDTQQPIDLRTQFCDNQQSTIPSPQSDHLQPSPNSTISSPQLHPHFENSNLQLSTHSSYPEIMSQQFRLQFENHSPQLNSDSEIPSPESIQLLLDCNHHCPSQFSLSVVL